MGIEKVIELIAQSGGLLGLAIFAIYALNRTWQDRIAEQKQVTDIRITAIKQQAEDYRALAEECRQTMEENTAILTKLCERLTMGKIT